MAAAKKASKGKLTKFPYGERGLEAAPAAADNPSLGLAAAASRVARRALYASETRL